MNDMESPKRYAEPAIDSAQHDGGVGLVILLALGLAVAAVGLAVVSREVAEPFVLAILAGLAVIGVFCLFAGAVGILHFGARAGRNDLTKAFVDNLPHGALIADRQGRVLYANAAYRELLGHPAGSALSTPERALVGHAHIAENMFRLSRAAQQGRALREEFKLEEPSEEEGEEGTATPRWVSISVRPLPRDPGSGGRGGLVVWEIEDVTATRLKEDETFASLNETISYLDNAPAGFFSVDPSGRIDYLNATLAHWLGLDLAELARIPLSISQIMAADAAGLVTRPGRDGSGAVRRFDIDLIRKDGTSLPARLLYRPGRGPDSPAHVLVLNRASGELEEAAPAELRFARLFNAAPIAIATVDRAGTIRATNAAFLKLFNRDANDEAPRVKLTELVAQGEARAALAAALDKALAGQAVLSPVDFSFEGEPQRSGKVYLAPIAPSEGDRSDKKDGEAAIVYAIDTTEQRALEMQIAQSQKMQAVGQLAGGIAHDFNNMLTAIIGFSDFLLMNHRPTDPAFQDIMNIKQNANRAAGLVRQLLAFSRQQTLHLQVLELGEVLSELTILLARLLGETIELKVDSARDLWPVKADLHQFEQVIINLAVNARDAMPNGGRLTIHTANVPQAEMRAFAPIPIVPGDYVMIEVRDTGHGMSAEVMDKIFEPFFSTKEVGRGTGLGLSTVYGIVKQTGGYIFPQSEVGKGTVMRVFLPRYEAPALPAEATVEIRRDKPKDLTGRGTVLLVEDEDAVRAFAARALSTRGYRVLQAATGAEALSLFAENHGEIDLVVSDVVMPEMDGPTLLRRLREQRPDLKIIFISGYAEESFRRNLSEDEDFLFLQKPFDLKELAGAVKAVLQG